MDSSELRDYLARNVNTRYTFGKVLAIDELALFSSPSLGECFFIVNTHPHFLPGEHWFSIYCPPNTNNPIEIFDSLGEDPKCYDKGLLYFIQGWKRGYCFNTMRLQSSESWACGLFSLYFICGDYRGSVTFQFCFPFLF